MKKWEYNVIFWDAPILKVQDSFDLQDSLNENGVDGWEVVSMSPQFGGISGATKGFIILLKRELI